MRKYAVVVEKGSNNLSAYVPDLPGCVTTGKTLEEVESNIRDAIQFHLEGLAQDGLAIPEPSSHAFEIELPVEPIAVRGVQRIL